MTGQIRTIKNTAAGAVTTPATTDALLVQQADGVTRYATAAQLLSLASSGGSAGPRARGYPYSTPTGYGPPTTGPVILIPYAVLPGTINGAFVAMHAADGANYYYTVSITKAGTTNAVNVAGLTNVYVSDGEGGGGNVASYQAPAHATATGGNTYAVGDLVQVTFSIVGGTFISTSFVLAVTE